jgi:galactokinase
MPDESVVPTELAVLVPADATVIVAAPGRANLIGEHTDYNDGLVLPVALDLVTVVAGRRAPHIRLRSSDHPGQVEIDPVTGDGPSHGWGRYVTAVVRALRDAGHAVVGLDGTIASTVPSGTGLSSSASLEVAVAVAVLERPISALDLALACREAENRYVGVQSGIMDPLVSAAARRGTATLIDCRSLETRPIPLPRDLRIVVVDSGERRRLADGEYNRRRAECEAAARALGVRSLREIGLDELDGARLPAPLGARARHVVTENGRVEATVAALLDGDLGRIGELFAESHRSLARDFEVSTPLLDALVEAARTAPDVIGARMTGAGFGGCTVNLVLASRAQEAADAIVDGYARRTGERARAWISPAASGAFELGAIG